MQYKVILEKDGETLKIFVESEKEIKSKKGIEKLISNLPKGFEIVDYWKVK